MKIYIRTLLIGAVTGAVTMQLINMAVDSLLKKGLVLGGEILLPVLIGLIGYISWTLAEAWFTATKHKEIYRRGLNDGMKIHTYTIVIPESDEINI